MVYKGMEKIVAVMYPVMCVHVVVQLLQLLSRRR